MHIEEKSFLHCVVCIFQHFQFWKNEDLPLEKAERATKLLFEILKLHQTDYLITGKGLVCICNLGHGLNWCIDDHSSLRLPLTLIQMYWDEYKDHGGQNKKACLKLINFFAKKDAKVKEFMGNCGAVKIILQLIQAKRDECKFLQIFFQFLSRKYLFQICVMRSYYTPGRFYRP